MALCGEGAPLVPYFDYIIFTSDSLNRLVHAVASLINLDTHFAVAEFFSTQR